MSSENKFIFAPPKKSGSSGNNKSVQQNDTLADSTQPPSPWRIAIIDDDDQVHVVTRMVLKNFVYDNRPVEFISAYSGVDGLELFKQYDDIAVCLLDVVMETDHAGLELARLIREEIRNKFTRIVLRTGQPGYAPEDKVISDYDINDYKEKTELTRSKLRTLMFSCLRSYRDIISLNEARQGLEKVISASTKVFSMQFIEEFSKGILQQVSSILSDEQNALYGASDGLVAHQDEEEGGVRIVAGIGAYADKIGENLRDNLSEKIVAQLQLHKDYFYSAHTEGAYLACYHSEGYPKNALYFENMQQRDSLQSKLLDIYSRNVLVAFENLYLKVESEEAQREIVYMLGEAVESRSNETGYHLKRVANISCILAKKLNLSEQHIDLIYQAAPLHDLGKIGIPDSILNKPDKLDSDEWSIMQKHVAIGYEMMRHSNKMVLRTGALIALDHHERWDGQGYPNKKAGEEISIEGRIVAIADVFDALASKRCYKKPWAMEEVLEYMQKKSGSQFDPRLIDILFESQDDIQKLYSN